MRLWQGMACVRIFLVSDKYKLSDVRKTGLKSDLNDSGVTTALGSSD